MRSISNGASGGNGNGLDGNSLLAPYTWRNGYQAPPPYRASWDGTFGDPLYKVF